MAPSAATSVPPRRPETPCHALRAAGRGVAAQRTNDRRLPLREFIQGPGQTALGPGEILTGVWIPKNPSFNHQHYEKVGQRRALAIAIVSLAALIDLGPGGIIQDIRLAWGSVGPTVVTAPAVEAGLRGRPLTLETMAEAAREVRRIVAPIDDLRAGADYRREVAGNLLYRLSLLAENRRKSDPDRLAMSTEAPLWTREFIYFNIAVFLAFINMAVFFSFEEYLRSLPIDPQWFGLLMASFRPWPWSCGRSSVFLPWRQRPHLDLLGTLGVMAALAAYDWADTLGTMAALRLLHGAAHVFLATALLTVIVLRIPPGRSGQAFGLLSIITLLPMPWSRRC